MSTTNRNEVDYLVEKTKLTIEVYVVDDLRLSALTMRWNKGDNGETIHEILNSIGKQEGQILPGLRAWAIRLIKKISKQSTSMAIFCIFRINQKIVGLGVMNFKLTTSF